MTKQFVNILVDINLFKNFLIDNQSCLFVLYGYKETRLDTLFTNLLAINCFLNTDENIAIINQAIKARSSKLPVLGIASNKLPLHDLIRKFKTRKSFFIYLTTNQGPLVQDIHLIGNYNFSFPVNLIAYNSCQLLSAGLLAGDDLPNNHSEPLFNFCLQSMKLFSTHRSSENLQQVPCSFIPELPTSSSSSTLTDNNQKATSNLFFNWFYTLFSHTTVGPLIYNRFKAAQFCWKNKNNAQLRVNFYNIIYLIMFDLTLSLLLLVLFNQYSPTLNWLENCLSAMESIVSKVEQLINSLIGMPAGLKLNGPLNTALGNFFLYHIHIWKTYINLIRPFLTLILDLLGFFGLFGFTFLLSFFSDLISLASIHIYCFYGYAARLYSFQLSGLIALWRLFRGKKWNTLKSRVDSCSYGHDQLFIGTVCFTILIFLLPTILLYYYVFLCLRLITLFSQMAIKAAIGLILSIPFYSLLLWAFGSEAIKTNLSFSIIASKERILILSMVLRPMTLKQLLYKHTNLEDNPFSFKKLMPPRFEHSLLTGSLL